jgi:hypothetical protein
MKLLLIFWYDIIDDYVFYNGKNFYCVNELGKKFKLLYSPRFEFICEVYSFYSDYKIRRTK